MVKLDGVPVRFGHEQTGEPIGHLEFNDQTHEFVLIREDVAEAIYAATIRPVSFVFRERRWSEREAEAIYNRALRRWIPASFRRIRDDLRYRLARLIWPFDSYDEDDD